MGFQGKVVLVTGASRGIGKAIARKLQDYRVKTLGELRNRPALLTEYGKTGKDLYNKICGIDNENVVPNNDRKGIGISSLEDSSEIALYLIYL